MKRQVQINKIRKRRASRTRARIFGTARRPRVCFFRSNKHSYAQVINDDEGKTLLSAHPKELGKNAKKTKTEQALSLGETLADKMKKEGINRVVFDRGQYSYQGRARAFVDGLRNNGIRV